MKSTNSLRGVSAILTVGVLYGFYGVFTRMVGESFTVFSQAMIRNGVAGVLALALIIYFGQKLHRPNKYELPWMILWLAMGSIAMILMFVGFNNLPVGLTYFLLYSTMISTGLLTGKIIFKERISAIKAMSFVFSILGLLLIYIDSLSLTLPAVFVLLAGICLGIWNTISKKFSTRFSDFELVVIDGFVGVLVGAIGMLMLKESLPPINFAQLKGWFWVIAFGISQVMSISLMVYGFKRIEAQVGSLILPIEVVFAVIFGYLFFREIPSPFTFIGGALIGCAAILPGIEAIRQQRRRTDS